MDSRLQLNLPHPVTDEDKSFLTFLLAGIREKRKQATAGPVIVVKKERTA